MSKSANALFLIFTLLASSCSFTGEPKARNVEDIQKIVISQKTNNELVLLILLSADGTVNRMGDGVLVDERRNLNISTTQAPLLEQFKNKMNNQMLEWMGSYSRSKEQSPSCLLEIGIAFSDGSEGGYRFSYDIDTFDIPAEIMYLVNMGVKLTNPWYMKNPNRIFKDSEKSENRCVPILKENE